MDATDYELIEMCLSGKQEAFEEIISRYKKLVSNVIYNLSINRSDVSDLSQETFLRVYKSIHSYNPDYKFATWLIKITTNVCLDWLRQKKNHSISMEDFSETPDDQSNPESEYIENEELRILRQAIKELPEKYRIPVILFHQQRLSYKEIEKILKQPETIIKNRLYRGRIMLRKKLQSQKKEVQ